MPSYWAGSRSREREQEGEHAVSTMPVLLVMNDKAHHVSADANADADGNTDANDNE